MRVIRADRQRSPIWVWLALSVIAVVCLFSLLAILLGAAVSLFALTPGTDSGDANVLSRMGPVCLLAGILGLVLGRRSWRAVRRSSRYAFDVFGRTCPQCKRRALTPFLDKSVISGRSRGLRVNPVWSWFRCAECDARFKQRHHGPELLEPVAVEEWQEHVASVP